MKLKITKKTILLFIFGIITWFIIDMLWDRNGIVNDFKQGFEDGIGAVDGK